MGKTSKRRPVDEKKFRDNYPFNRSKCCNSTTIPIGGNRICEKCAKTCEVKK